MGKWAINGIMAIVSLTWAASIIAGMVKPSYIPPPTVHLAMMAIVGALFGRQVLGKAFNEPDKPGEGKPPGGEKRPPADGGEAGREDRRK